MKNMIHRMTTVLALLAGAAGSVVQAQDLAPSWRGQPGSGRQEWRFDSSANPATPELVSGLSTGAKASITAGQFSMGWQSQLPGMGADRTGLWDLGRNGTVTLMLNNPSNYTRISVQVSQWLDGGIYSELATVSVPGATQENADTGLTSTATVGGWFVDETDWLVPAGAVVDRILVTGAYNGSVIDRAGVDTLTPVTVSPVNLNIARVSGGTNRVEISWSFATDSYDLESSTNLSDTQGWHPVAQPAQVTGDLHSVVIEAGDTVRFYRLKQH